MLELPGKAAGNPFDPRNLMNWHAGAGKTTLDRVIAGLGRTMRRSMEAKDPKLGRMAAAYTNFELAHDMVKGVIQTHPSVRLMTADEIASSGYLKDKITVEPAIMATMLEPWLTPDKESPPLSLQIDADLAELFMAGRAPQTVQWLEVLQQRPVYLDIDVPGNNAERHVAAIFAVPVTGERRSQRDMMKIMEEFDRLTRATAQEAPVFGGASEKEAEHTLRLAIITERGRTAFDSFIFATLKASDSGDPELAHLTVLMADPSLSPQEMEKTVSGITAQAGHLLKMALLYRLTADDRHQQALAQTTLGELKTVAGKKAQAKEKTHSLFKVIRLNAPENRFSAVDQKAQPQPRRSWTLDYRVSVAMHFRMQHYGAGRSRQKLILIEPYERGPKGHRYYPKERPVLIEMEDEEQTANPTQAHRPS